MSTKEKTLDKLFVLNTVKVVYWDLETFSSLNLTQCGAYSYALDPSTGIHFMCFAIDGGEVQTWRRSDPVPVPFADPVGYKFVSDNWEFERLLLEHVLIPRYGFAPIPIAQQDCAQRRALANAFPAELGLRCEALGLPYKKNPEARKAMLRLSRPQTAKKRKKAEDPAAHERDLALVLERCRTDVESTRAAYNHPRMHPLLPEEQHLLTLDAAINARGVYANMPFLNAGCTLAVNERNAINTRLNELTAGVITSVFQRDRIVKLINARGHAISSLTKRSVSATLAHKPEDLVREILTLRQRGAYTSVQKFKKLLAFTNPDSHRIHGSLRFHGGAPGRWSSIGAQLHNKYPASLVDALIAGNHIELARFGNPLEVVRGLSRAILCAAPGQVLICVDFSSIESRVTAWLAGEEWKLEHFRRYDATGDKSLDLYVVLARTILQKNDPNSEISAAERQLGKCAELAAGFGGSIGAWRRIANDEDTRTDTEVLAIIHAWRSKHPAIGAFWQRLMRAARISIRSKQAIRVMPPPRPSVVTSFDGIDLNITLPSGRAINYPNARLAPNRKFEDGEPDIEFIDNARGQWKWARAWFGTLVENIVQGAARDLLSSAIVRAEARGWKVVFHCHDELVVEAPKGTLSEQDVLTMMLEPPPWAEGLPLGGKVHTGPLYLEAPATGEPPAAKDEETVAHAIDAFIAGAAPLPDTKEVEQGAEEDFLASLGTTTAPLTDLVSLPMNASHHVACPFHEDWEPSCKIYADHWHCFSCGESPTISDALRFHPNCVFGPGERRPCIVALMRDPLTDAPVGIHRIGLQYENGVVRKISRMALGRMGVVKLWPLNGSDQLIAGEGIETTLAAATRIPYRGAALTPAWSTVNSDGMGRLPALPGVKQLILLIDNDENYEGQHAAERCQRIWKSAGRTTVPLMPKQKGWDFNDVVLGRKA